MGKINEELAALYASRLEGLQKMYAELEEKGITDYASPLIMYCYEDKYMASNKRFMVIGQETNSWDGPRIISDANIKRAMDHYKCFELGNRQGNPYRCPFWNRVREINGKLNGEGLVGNFLWTNIDKFGKKDRNEGRVCDAVRDMSTKYFNVLQQEIEITKPDVCIFFTGPYRDGDIRKQLSDAQFEVFIEGEDKRRIARVKSQYLPFASYRTYHPKAGLLLSGKRHFGKGWYENVLNKIVQDALKQ